MLRRPGGPSHQSELTSADGFHDPAASCCVFRTIVTPGLSVTAVSDREPIQAALLPGAPQTITLGPGELRIVFGRAHDGAAEFIGTNRDPYGVESICSMLPIAPSTFYEHQIRWRNPDRCTGVMQSRSGSSRPSFQRARA